MDGLLIIATLLTLPVGLVVWRLLRLSRQRRWLSMALWGSQGMLWLAALLIVLLAYGNLHSYQRLTHEQEVAQVIISELDSGRFQLLLAFTDSGRDPVLYQLQGDQWQLDARILKWTGWANLLGLDAYYRLERLSGRFDDIETARKRLPSVYDLGGSTPGLDIWRMKRLLRDKMPFVDTLYGQGVFMPLVDGARYRVSVGQAGLVVRPANEAARAAVF